MPDYRGILASRARGGDQIVTIGSAFVARFKHLIVLSFLSGAVAACQPILRDFGYAPSDSELAEIVVGVDSVDKVQEVVGFPASDGLVREGSWYYLAARQRTVGFRAPQTVNRQLVAIRFNSQGTVTNIERFALEDGRVIALSRRVTESGIQDVPFLRQLLSNLGRIDTDAILGQ